VPFPQLPRKYRWEPLYTATDFRRYVEARRGTRSPRHPAGVVIVFGERWTRYLNRAFRLDRKTGLYRAGRSVGVVHVRGPGAPFATVVVEELSAWGVQRFVIVGLAGSLDRGISAGSMVICTKALRDEGTSHHYQKAAPFSRPDPQLTNSLKGSLRSAGIPYSQGPSWTTDAPYRETVPEVRRYRKAGILTVEMEASAVFTVTRALGRSAAALFVISDHLDEAGWEPRVHDTRVALREALRVAIRTLEN